MSACRKLRFGIMCTGNTVNAFQADVIRRLLAIEGVNLSLLIIEADPPKPSNWQEKLKKLFTGRGQLWAIFLRLFHCSKIPSHLPADMSKEFAGVPHRW